MAPPLRPTDVHVDKVLTNFAVAYPFNEFIAHEVFPVVPVKFESDKYYKFRRGDRIVIQSRRADGALSERADFGYDTDTYSCEEYALHTDVGARTLKNADSPLRPLEDAAANVKEMVLLDREIQAQAIAQASGLPKASPGVKWDVYATSTIVEDWWDAKQEVRDKIGRDPTHVVMNDKVRDIIIKWLLTEKVGAGLRFDAIAPFLEAGQLPATIWNCIPIIGMARKSSKLRDDDVTAATLSDVWTDNVTFIYRAPRPGIKTMSYGYTFRCGGELVRRWTYQDARRAQGVEYCTVEDFKEVTTDACFMVENVIT